MILITPVTKEYVSLKTERLLILDLKFKLILKMNIRTTASNNCLSSPLRISVKPILQLTITAYVMPIRTHTCA